MNGYIEDIRTELEAIRALMAQISDAHDNVPEHAAEFRMAYALGHAQGNAAGAAMSIAMALHSLDQMEKALTPKVLA
jgi:hypothetical protein